MIRPSGQVYAKLPREGVPGVESDVVVEVCQYVYGLAEAPRQWWLCLSGESEKLGIKRSLLDFCCYYWYSGGKLQGVCASHVDDLIMGGPMNSRTLCWLRGGRDFRSNIGFRGKPTS